ncbi:MAG TPA: mechanosensitive ion channel domain-containing protein [Natronosporangium sp.]|nr:mechanosensitive ion channel domain-containing protein [Natronosporangium sp.]
MQDIWRSQGPLIVTVLALVAGFVVVGLVYRALRRAGRHVPILAMVARRTHQPAQILVAILVALVAVQLTTRTGAWRGPLLHGLVLGAIAAGAWLVVTLLRVAEEKVLAYMLGPGRDGVAARRARTQVTLLRRVAIAVVVLVAVGAGLSTFETVRGLGTSVLASAGLLGVVGGLAAQSTLSNLFAGMQLAFGDRLRIDDVVVVEGEWGRVEELTLGYVVIRIWDERRMILPTSYFTTTPFVNWTRSGADIHGTVELDVDWTVPVAELREELRRYVSQHPLWDGRSVSLQVTEATGGRVRVRALLSAADGGKIWGLRCDVREHLVEWVRTRHPQALPRTRTELTVVSDPPDEAPPAPHDRHAPTREEPDRQPPEPRRPSARRPGT